MAYLRHLVNGTTVTVYELAEQCSIGRSKECSIRVDDPTVSALHATIVCQGDTWMLSDTGSTNGVFIKGKRMAEAVLADKTLFTLGTHEFEFLERVPTDLDKTLEIKKSWIPGVYYTE